MSRVIEFFEGDHLRLSMTRLLCFMSFFPASYVVIVTKSENALGWYLSSYVLGYVGGKVSDMMGKPKPQQVPVDNVESVNVANTQEGEPNARKPFKPARK
jgi:hypothetical protein